MTELYEILIERYYADLSEIIKGEFNIYVIDDALNIEIYNRDFEARYQLANVSDLACYGLPRAKVIERIVRDYRRCINRLYFY